MAKGCLDKLGGNLTVTCEIPDVGIREIYLVRPEDVTLTFTDSNRQISKIVFASGARSYKVEGYKQNIQISAGIRALDASQRIDVSIRFRTSSFSAVSRIVSSGSYYVLVIGNAPGGSSFTFWGVNSPLECTNLEYDSYTNNGLRDITLSAPEGSAGNNYTICSAAVKDSIIAKSV